MDALELAAAIVASLAWPAVMVFLCFRIRKWWDDI